MKKGRKSKGNEKQKIHASLKKMFHVKQKSYTDDLHSKFEISNEKLISGFLL